MGQFKFRTTASAFRKALDTPKSHKATVERKQS